MHDSTASEEMIARFVADVVPPKGDVLLVVPPFLLYFLPALGPHLLQAIGRQAGFDVHVLYANLLFARLVGAEDYDAMCAVANRSLLGERVFAAAAYGLPPLGLDAQQSRSRFEERMSSRERKTDWASYEKAATTASLWADALSAAITRLDYRIVGFSSMFEQTSASVALVRRIKQRRPDVVTVIGGANCEGEMAEGVASLSDDIDFVFSQESDSTFPAFVEQVLKGRRPAERIVTGEPCSDLDRLPTPSYRDSFRQIEWLFPRSDDTSGVWDKLDIPFECSRGCWWGQKNQCTFCGQNGLGMTYREKSADRVLQQLEEIVAEYSTEVPRTDKIKMSMTDNIMPRSYFRTLLPRLRQAVPDVSIFYEQKANLTLEEVVALKSSGIDRIQPGIESLSTSYLKRMSKGVTAPQNIALLRYAASVDLSVGWALLTHFPGDELEELQQILTLVPLMRHLPPPIGPFPMSVDRFGSYHAHPEASCLSDLRPLPAYAEVFPAGAKLRQLAYFFEAEYDCASARHPEVISRLDDEVRAWTAAWSGDTAPPMLSVQAASSAYRGTTGREFVLVDTRGLPGTRYARPLTRSEASLLLVKRPWDASSGMRSAVDGKLAVELDGYLVPLASADPTLLLELEDEAGAQRRRVDRKPA